MRRLLVACAFAYPVLLLLLSAGFYFVGEDWWVTAAALYAPRLVFLLPLPVGVLALWLAGLRRYVWTQVVAGLVALVPLMGFTLSLPPPAHSDARKIRVLSFNVDSGIVGTAAIVERVAALSPDVVLLQEAPFWNQELLGALRASYPFVESSTQFVVASRFRIVSSSESERVSFYGRARSSRFMRYELETPLGEIAVYSVHPLSPRGLLHVQHFRAALHLLRTGQLLAGDPESDVRANVGLRALQIATAAEAAKRESLPVLIAGDTNLPGLSAIFRKYLSGFQDGFRAASSGFGYTFPDKHPFLRLDRILASDKLRFVSFQVDCKGASDHLCVVADVQARQ